MNDLILQWVTHYGYITIFSLLMVGILGVPVPDETIVAFAGYLSSKGDLMLLPALAAAFLGTVCGVTLSYGSNPNAQLPYSQFPQGSAIQVRVSAVKGSVRLPSEPIWIHVP